jgi:predicted alpha-1,2-mannosidase
LSWQMRIFRLLNRLCPSHPKRSIRSRRLFIFTAMKTIQLFILSILLFGSLPAQSNSSKSDQNEYQRQPYDYVNPFIGTINYGATNPGAVRPMGLISVVPFNVTKAEGNIYNMDEGWCSTPYWNDNKVITGFSHVNFSSVGCPDLGSILLMPTTGELTVDYQEYGSEYFIEKAYPGYYRTMLKKHGVIAQMTATRRTGLSEYIFPEGESHIVLNLGLGLTNETGAYIKRISETEVEGFKLMGTFCYNPQDVFPVYFAVRVSKTPESMNYWKYHTKLAGDKHNWSSTSDTYKIYDNYWKELAGENIGVVFNYQTAATESILVQVGISYVSTKNAWENLDAEQEGFKFAEVREEARTEWSNYLNTIKVEGGTEEDKEMFYTAFYHTLLHPNVFNDVNGEYPSMGTGEVKTVEGLKGRKVEELKGRKVEESKGLLEGEFAGFVNDLLTLRLFDSSTFLFPLHPIKEKNYVISLYF